MPCLASHPKLWRRKGRNRLRVRGVVSANYDFFYTVAVVPVNSRVLLIAGFGNAAFSGFTMAMSLKCHTND